MNIEKTAMRSTVAAGEASEGVLSVITGALGFTGCFALYSAVESGFDVVATPTEVVETAILGSIQLVAAAATGVVAYATRRPLDSLRQRSTK